MNVKSTLQNVLAAAAFVSLVFAGNTAGAQDCPNERVFWSEDFGQGPTVTSSPDVSNLVYTPTGSFLNEGIYRITDNMQLIPDWHNSGDHTGNLNGRMLVINGQDVAFYSKTVTSPDANGFSAGTYSVSFYAMNANGVMVCGPSMLLAQLQVTIEYLDANNNWVALGNSPVTYDPLQHSDNPLWVNLTANFNLLTASSNFHPSQIRFTISDLMHGGCGNDFAIDDIKFGQCNGGEGGPMPVTFVNVTAQQKGSGVSVDWSTSQEINNDRFEVERSANGSTGWQTIATVGGAGTTNEARSYSAFDASPLAGANYYRVRQVDIDGKSAYSKTVSLRVNGGAARVSVIGNPFTSNFTVKFSGQAQEVNARLLDITGKQVLKETWSIPNGETSRQLGNVANLQKGIYILTIQGRNGDILFNGKVLKQ